MPEYGRNIRQTKSHLSLDGIAEAGKAGDQRGRIEEGAEEQAKEGVNWTFFIKNYASFGSTEIQKQNWP